MQLLTVKKCCGCMSLRTGGLVIGYLYLFGAFTNLEVPGRTGIGPFVASVLAYGAWIYGVMNKRRTWLIPGLIVSVFSIVLLLLNLLIIPLLGTAYREETISYMNKLFQYVDEDPIDDSTLSAILLTAWAIVAISAVVHWHFMAVMFSLYHSMKEEECFQPSAAPYSFAEMGEMKKGPPPPPY